MIGQEETKARLMQLMEEKRLPHALLFCGPAGCGKMAMAMAFASYLLISTANNDNAKRNAEAMLAQWQHPDLHFTFPVIRPTGTSADHKMVSDDFAKVA